MPDRISTVRGWQALDSRGRPTVGVVVGTTGGHTARAIVPSGASTGSHEATEIRDGGPDWDGWGVQRAVDHVNTLIAPELTGQDVMDQDLIDTRMEMLDGTPTLSTIGANAVLATSLATYLCAAAVSGRPLYEHAAADAAAPLLLPRPMFNIISGGAHAAGVIDIQDVLAIPLTAHTFAEAIEVGCQVRAGTAQAMTGRGLPTGLVADEGGLAGPLNANRQALDLIVEGIERAGFTPGAEVGIAIDVAANQLLDQHRYQLRSEGRDLAPEEWISELLTWCADYPIVSIEDPLVEDEWADWSTFTRELAQHKTGVRQVIGDDLFATNLDRVRRGVATDAGTAVLVKPNQAGTVTRARAVLDFAHKHGLVTVLSARSGDTEDTWLADLAVGWRAGQIKVGSTMRSERTAKWNRLLEIEAISGRPTELAAFPSPAPATDRTLSQ
jgi:enolase